MKRNALNPNSKEFKDLVNTLTSKKLPGLYSGYLGKLNKNELFLLALELDLPDLINFCKSSKRINEKVCESKEIWIHKLKEDFNITYSKRYNLEPKKNYILLYKMKEGIEILDDAPILYDLLYNPRSVGYLWYSLPNDDKDRRKMHYIISFLHEKVYEEEYEEEDEDGYGYGVLEELWFKYREKLSSLLPFHKKGVDVTLEDIDNFWDNAGDLITKIQEKSEYKMIKGIEKRAKSIGNPLTNKEIEALLSLNELVKNNIFSITVDLNEY